MLAHCVLSTGASGRTLHLSKMRTSRGRRVKKREVQALWDPAPDSTLHAISASRFTTFEGVNRIWPEVSGLWKFESLWMGWLVEDTAHLIHKR